jgi:hypothetical protein
MISETRVPLSIIMTAFQQDDSPEQIADSYTAVSLKDVYAVIAYYLQQERSAALELRLQLERKKPRDVYSAVAAALDQTESSTGIKRLSTDCNAKLVFYGSKSSAITRR